MKIKRIFLFKVYTLLAFLTLAGCVMPTTYPELTAEPYPSSVVPAQQRIAGRSVENRPIMYLVLGQGPDTTFILSTIHGDEPAGTPLVQRLAEYLQQNPDLLRGRTVVLLPVANPDGLARKSRFNANGVDLNRNFEADNRVNIKEYGPVALSEPESRAIERIIQGYNPDRIVSIHQPFACIDYDGPGVNLAIQMALYCDLPIKKLGAKSGSLGSYAGVDLGIPIITFEMSETDSKLDSEVLWQKYGKALIAAIVYPEPVK